MDFQIENEPSDDSEYAEMDFRQIDESIQDISKGMRRGDWAYLGRHPEIRAIVRFIIMEAAKNKKQKCIFRFVADLFQEKNKKMLQRLINKQLKWVNKQVKSGKWSPADGAMSFTATSETSLGAVKKSSCEHDLKNAKSDDDLPSQKNQCPENYQPNC
ncbi:uncharacterized protein LOC6568716 [Drosophila grimshawi]|uniref:GH22811 n=1 Tax=Drosophila grimshawi TaxID=7222 RepID=B4JW51_DROGR|nr:uncharacterized protein LOC6568716 [Drosophila grimshawi]EDV98189.1 GH22811 [Drosophila grimshawi]